MRTFAGSHARVVKPQGNELARVASRGGGKPGAKLLVAIRKRSRKLRKGRISLEWYLVQNIEPHSSTSGLSLAVNQLLLGNYFRNYFVKSLTKT